MVLAQGVEIIDCTEKFKMKGAYNKQHEDMINPVIKELNNQGKRVINISISQTSGYTPLYVCILWEMNR